MAQHHDQQHEIPSYNHVSHQIKCVLPTEDDKHTDVCFSKQIIKINRNVIPIKIFAQGGVEE